MPGGVPDPQGRWRSTATATSPLPRPAGVDKIHDLGLLSDYEKDGLKAMMPELLASIEKGIQFVKGA